MKLKITYHLGNYDFCAIANDIAEAYDYVKAIVERERVYKLSKAKQNIIRIHGNPCGF